MLVARVVDHQIGDHPDSAPVGLFEHYPDVLDRAALCCHRAIVRDVVAAVSKRRRVERQQPEAVDAEPVQVVELLDDAGDIPDAVAVRVVEGPRQQLVEDRPLEPVRPGPEHRRCLDAGVPWRVLAALALSSECLGISYTSWIPLGHQAITTR